MSAVLPPGLARQLPMARRSLPLVVAAVTSALVGVGVAGGSRMALILPAVICAACLLSLPVAWLASLGIAASLAYRLAAPTTTGPVSIVPDALLALTVVKVAGLASMGHLGRPLDLARRIAWPLALLGAVAVVSAVRNDDPAASLLFATRQFGRFPVWGLALSLYGLSWPEARRLVAVVLGCSLVQLPLAAYQAMHPPANPFRDVVFFPGDNVSGSFGIGGSNTEMIFLVLCALLWLALVLHRQLPAWVVWVIAPALVVPMALGSAAAFVILLPSTVVVLFIRSAMARGNARTWGAAIGAVVLIGVGLYGASSLALAPGFAGAPPPSASVILQARYLSRYLADTSAPTGHSRLGFLHLAVETDARDGWGGLLVGQGPASAVVGEPGRQVGPTRQSVLGRSSVQSVPRVVLGLGFLGLAAFVLLVLSALSGFRGREPEDGVAAALRTMLPVAGGVFLAAGLYNASWTDPGIAVTFWTLAVCAHAGWRSPAEPAPPEGVAP